MGKGMRGSISSKRVKWLIVASCIPVILGLGVIGYWLFNFQNKPQNTYWIACLASIGGLFIWSMTCMYRRLNETLLRPMNAITNYVIHGDIDALRRLTKHNTDFGVVATMLEDAAKQKAALEWEMDARRTLAEEMFRAKQEAETNNDYKSQFLANMSHELRTPMNGVIGMTSLLIDTDLSPQQREYTELIQKSANSLLNVVNDILDYSKIEAGKMQSHSEIFDLRALIEDVLELLAPQARAKNIEVIADLGFDLPHRVDGDSLRVRQIIMNLLGNAIKFTEKGYVRIEAKTIQKVHNEALIRIAIEDTGIGIPKDRRDAIFESFTQADGGTTRKYGGTGLGLTISRRLTEILGGALEFHSAPGSGSTFWFELPFGVPTRRTEDASLETTHRQVLAVVENPAFGAAIKRELETLGAHATILHYSEIDRNPHLINANMILWDAAIPSIRSIVEERLPKRNRNEDFDVLVGWPDDIKNLGPAADRFDSIIAKPIRFSKLAAALRSEVDEGHKLANGEKRPLRILVADDNEVNRRVVEQTLVREGYDVVTVADGSVAHRHFLAEPFDAILLDLNMPVMDGFETVKAIRQSGHDLAATIPILCMTADDDREALQQAVAAGMNGSISKPFRACDLITTLEGIAETPTPMTKSASEPKIEPSTVAFDPTNLTNAFGSDMAAIKEVIAAFAAKSPALLQSMETAIGSQNFEALRFHAHALRGMSSTVGCGEIAEWAKQIENFSSESQIAMAKPAFEQLRVALPTLLETLSKFEPKSRAA